MRDDVSDDVREDVREDEVREEFREEAREGLGEWSGEYSRLDTLLARLSELCFCMTVIMASLSANWAWYVCTLKKIRKCLNGVLTAVLTVVGVSIFFQFIVYHKFMLELHEV